MTCLKYFLSAIYAAFMAGALQASDLARPDGLILLTVSGDISNTNEEQTAQFDRAMLESLDWTEIVSFTSLTEGPQVFAGPTLSSLLDAVGARGTRLRATAIDNYSIVIPAADAAEHNVILAMERNGVPMPVRSKGPIWVIYPLSEADAEKKKFFREMIWHLYRLSVER